jgi:hypothetical protein
VPQRGVRGAAKLELLPFIDVLLHKFQKIVLFNQLGVPPIFKDLKGAETKKMLKTLYMGNKATMCFGYFDNPNLAIVTRNKKMFILELLVTFGLNP